MTTHDTTALPTRDDLLDLVQDLVTQACSIEPTADGWTLDDMCMSIYEEAFEVLEHAGRIETAPMRFARVLPRSAGAEALRTALAATPAATPATPAPGWSRAFAHLRNAVANALGTADDGPIDVGATIDALEAALDESQAMLRDSPATPAAQGAAVSTSDECPGLGECHGSMKWCGNCGDTSRMCHDGHCDVHSRDGLAARRGEAPQPAEPPRAEGEATT